MGFFSKRLSDDQASAVLALTKVDTSVQLELAHAEEIAKLRQQLAEMQTRVLDSDARMNAISLSQSMLEFALDGTILSVNDNFLQVTGFARDEVLGRNVAMLFDTALKNSAEYREWWAKLQRGSFDAAVYKQLGKAGREIWIRGSYNPVLGANGHVVKVINIGTDITSSRLRNYDTAGQLKALNKALAVVEFNMDGSIIAANEKFLGLTGYSLPEIQGKHHGIFLDDHSRNTHEYREFWAKLNRGEYDAGDYKRTGKGGAELWIHASYNPIFDQSGRVYKVVKFASDITAQQALQSAIQTVMEDTMRVMGSLSSGKLHDKMSDRYSGEFEKLANAINAYIDRLSHMVSEITDAAHAVKQGSAEIAVGNTNLSQRTEEQAATLEQTSASMEEMMSTVQQNAVNADQAANLAKSAKITAEKGGDIVRKAVVAMQDINVASNKINDIIGVIDEIAFQTNLLALNAAVEAARAGDQGRGFAVVADEVRNLAGRSATAAKEIKGLIKDSHEKVKEGTTLVNNSGNTLEEIVASVKKVNDIISEIATASAEQSTGLNEVNRSVTEMDKMTQQNAALVEEAAAASEALGTQAESLQHMISFFDLGTGVSSGNRGRYPRR